MAARGTGFTLLALLAALLAFALPAPALSATDQPRLKALEQARPATSTSIAIKWSGPTGSRRYTVSVNGRVRARTNGRSITLTALRCASRYRIDVAVAGRPQTGRTLRLRTSACRRALSKRAPGSLDGSALTLAAIDVTPPVITIGSPATGSGSDDSTPLIGGYAGGLAGDSALVTIRVYAGATVSGPPLQSISTPRLTGNWYLTEPVALPLGTYTFRGEQTDTAGNTGYSPPVTYSVTGVDNVAPVVSLVSPPASSADTTPTLAGIAGQLLGDSTSVTLRLYAGNNTSGTLVQTISATRGTGGAYAIDAAALTPSTYTARAEQADSAGNTGYSTPATFAITGADTVAPTVTLNAPPASSTDVTPTFAGTSGIAVGDSTSLTIRIHTGTTTSGSLAQSVTTTRDAAGAYSVDAAALAPGTYTARTEQTDTGANTGYSPPRTFTILAGADLVAPLITIGSPADNTTVDTPKPLIGGYAGGLATDSATITVRIYAGPAISGSPLQSFTASRLTGNWYLTEPPLALTPGQYTLRAEQTDTAANTGYSAPVRVTVTGPGGDTTAPVVSLTAPAASSTNATPALAGFAGQAYGDSASVTLRIHSGTSVAGNVIQTQTATADSGGAYSINATTLAAGTYTARASQSDAAGNTGYSQPATFTITGGGTGGGGTGAPPGTVGCTLYGPYHAGNQPPACWKPYAATSPFNRPLPASPRLSGNSPAIVSRLLSWGEPQTMLAGHSLTNGDYFHPLYYSRSSDPLFTVQCMVAVSSCEVHGDQVRIPDAARAASAGDGHMAVIDQSSGIEYDFWQVRSKPAGGGTITISHGGKTRIDGDGLGSNATAAWIGLAAGIIRGPEMTAGSIDHALFAAIKCTSGTSVYPAQPGTTANRCSDFGLSNTNAPPLGTHLQLNMSDAEINALNIPSYRKIILRALARYGLIVGDTNGGNAAWGIQVESGASYTSFGLPDPWVAVAQNAGLTPFNNMYGIDINTGVDWTRFRVLDPCVSQGNCQ